MDRTQDIGIFSAYGFAREGGYTGTKEEFEEGLARSADYANNAQVSAQTASNKAQQAFGYAQTASDKADLASGYASDASGYADAAAASATIASELSQTLYMDANGLFYINVEEV